MDLLPFWMQYTAAMLIFAGLVAGAIYFIVWAIKWARNYFDPNKSATDT